MRSRRVTGTRLRPAPVTCQSRGVPHPCRICKTGRVPADAIPTLESPPMKLLHIADIHAPRTIAVATAADFLECLVRHFYYTGAPADDYVTSYYAENMPRAVDDIRRRCRGDRGTNGDDAGPGSLGGRRLAHRLARARPRPLPGGHGTVAA